MSLDSSTRDHTSAVARWLRFVVTYPWPVLGATLVVVAVAGLLTSGLRKDTSANAYIEPDNPALLYRDRVIDTFGLKEPIVIAVRNAGDDGIFNAASLQRVRELVTRLEKTPNIDTDRITSIVSVSAIAGGAEGLEIAPLLPEGAVDAAAIDRLRAVLDDTPIYDGTLVSKGRTATVIAAELIDESQAAQTYQAVLDLVASLPADNGDEVFVAGAGAITGYFSSYIDRDAGTLVPFAAVAISIVLFCAFFTIRACIVPMLIAVASVVITLGVMASAEVAFFAITNGMVVVLIGIGVAEPMHVFGEYYALLQQRPNDSNRNLVINAIHNVWRPIALTSITTVGGFFSLWLTSTMPPIRYFGLFGAFGVVVAWLLTVTFLPACMAILPRKPSPLMRTSRAGRPDPVVRAMLAVGRAVLRYPRTVLMSVTVLCGLALFSASYVKVDHARIENFNASEPLYVADREINRTLAGTNHLDIVIEAAGQDGVLTPDALRRIDGLQQFLERLPEVGGSTSIAEYIKQLNRAMHEGASSSFLIPEDRSLIAQLMLTYQASAPPTELQSLIDSSGRAALVRVYLRADRWSEQRRIVHVAQQFIDREFADSGLEATLTGRVMLDYQWVRSVASGHALSVAVSTLTVLLMCVVIFRSIRDGLLCLAPLFTSVVGVYAAMGMADIWLGVATSMFASVAIGLGIDFAIHMVARARKAAATIEDVDTAILHIYRSTGRAVLFNATAVGSGFAIVSLSAAPPIRMFGVLVATAMVGAFVAALTVLPAILKLIGEYSARRRRRAEASALPGAARVLAVAVCAGAMWSPHSDAAVGSEPDAEAVMHSLASRPEGSSADRRVHIQLIDRHGTVRDQVARAVRKNVKDGRRMAIFYESPSNIRGTSFLVYDYADAAAADDQWLYLPALRKVRRVPPADRGDYFLGTDLTYDEIRNDNRITLTDWVFRSGGTERIDGISCTVIDGTAISDPVARELGYSRARWWVDADARIARRIEYWDRGGNRLKTIDNLAVTHVDGIWSALRIEVTNHKTGHRTLIDFRDPHFDTPLPDSLFTQQQMERGL